jgi:uncharacterized protein
MIRRTPLVSALALAAFLSTAAAAQTIQINRDNKTIAISTTDEATAIADIAAVTIGFEVFGPDSDSAFAAGSKVSHDVLDALHKAGAEDKSIESLNQGLRRNEIFDEKESADERAKKQFVMNQSWTVSVPPASAAEVIRVAVAAGANRSGEIDWRLSDRKTLQAKAAENALIKARSVAANMAEGLHVKLGDLIYASNETPRTDFYPRAYEMKGTSMANDRGAATLAAPLPVIELRSKTIREEATVYAVFAIEPTSKEKSGTARSASHK